MANLRRTDERARFAIIAMWVALFSSMVFLLMILIEIKNLRSYQVDENLYSYAYGNVVEWLYSIIIIVGFITNIVFIRWFMRLYYNIGVLSHGLSYSLYWSVWGWFIPVINWILPYLIFKEIYSRTNGLLDRGDRNNYLDMQRVSLYWVLYIVIDLSGYYMYFMVSEYESIEQTISTYYIDIIYTMLDVSLIVMLVKIIEEYQPFSAKLLDLGERDDLIDHLVE